MPQKLSSLHILIILSFISLIIIILSLPKTKTSNKPILSVSTIDTSLSINITNYTQNDNEIQKLIQQYEQKKISIDSLIFFLRQKKQLPLIAYFEELKYLSSLIDTVWYYLGKNYYNALGFISSPKEAEPLIASAARCFQRAITLNEKNTNARIMLASCYVQTQNPMLGIQMLKEIEKTDSANPLLHLQLAEFSLRSNQLDKAIQRYKKVLELDSSRIEVYAYLSEIYLQKKDTLQSIQFLRKFAAQLTDTTLANSINNYIESIIKAKN